MIGLEKNEPDVLLLDISMPNVNGLKVIPLIRKQFPKVKIILLTKHDETPFLNKALALGVNGYVLKTTGEEELFKAIRRVQNGEIAVDPFLAGELLRLNMAGQLAKKKNTESSGANLSEREVEVLKLVARGYTDKEISEMLNISVKTVEKHKLKIKDKTGSKRLASLIKFAMENGYM
ncbi:response regulator transcription factor [Desulfosporosinus nitroreducens]|nr:response regulator transcription factor [Desulfosporosinus nitroreducens]